MNHNSILLGYLAFASLKKLIKNIQLIKVRAEPPYVFLTIQLPFNLEEPLLTIFKEDLRRVIKKTEYKVFEMVPHVAQEYARHKNLSLDLINDDPIVTLVEFEHDLIHIDGQLSKMIFEEKSFDLLSIKSYKNQIYDLIFAVGDDVKTIKKNLKNAEQFNAINFLNKAGILDTQEIVFAQRGQDALFYYAQVVTSQLLKENFKFLSENPNDSDDVITLEVADAYHDPFVLDDFILQSQVLRVKFSSCRKKINSCLKSLIQILKMMSLNFQLHIAGKFQESELKEITLGIQEQTFLASDIRYLELKVLDNINRYKVIAKFSLFKKKIELSVDLLNLFFTHLVVNKKIYPQNLERPQQVAVWKQVNTHEDLIELYRVSRLKGDSCFFLDVKDLLSSKDALDYQIDKMVYFSASDGMVKAKSYD